MIVEQSFRSTGTHFITAINGQSEVSQQREAFSKGVLYAMAS